MSRQSFQWLICQVPMGAMIGAIGCGVLGRALASAHAPGGVQMFFGCLALSAASMVGYALLPVLTSLGWIDKSAAEQAPAPQFHVPPPPRPMPMAEVEMQPQALPTSSGNAVGGSLDLDIERGVIDAVRRRLGAELVFEHPPAGPRA